MSRQVERYTIEERPFAHAAEGRFSLEVMEMGKYLPDSSYESYILYEREAGYISAIYDVNLNYTDDPEYAISCADLDEARGLRTFASNSYKHDNPIDVIKYKVSLESKPFELIQV